MNLKLFSTLFDEVLIDVPGVTQPVALNAIRNSAIEFCNESGVWVETMDPISSIAAQAVYDFEPENGTEVSRVLQMYYNGVKIDPKTAAQLDDECSLAGSTFIAGTPWSEQTGVPKYYLIERPDEFTLAPYPSEAVANGIKMKVSLKPTRTSTGMEKWVMDQHFETLAHGAKGKLMSMLGKPWSNPDMASFHMREFGNGKRAASFQTSNTHKLPAMVSDPSPI